MHAGNHARSSPGPGPVNCRTLGRGGSPQKGGEEARRKSAQVLTHKEEEGQDGERAAASQADQDDGRQAQHRQPRVGGKVQIVGVNSWAPEVIIVQPGSLSDNS